MKKLLVLLLVPFFASCFSEKSWEEEKVADTSPIVEEKITTASGEEITETGIAIPPHEKSTSVEEEFSQDLNDLLKLLDEPQENE